jgi:archaeal flagellar protein FlaJ
MRKTKYVEFCEKLFGKFFLKNEQKELEEKNVILEKANIPLEHQEYYSRALMNVILFFNISLIASAVLYVLNPNYITMLLVAIIPVVITLVCIFLYLYLPTYKIKKRAENIDRFLPYAINFISSMAVAGVSPSEIFQTLSTIKVYGEIQIEAKRIAKEINVMGVDNITAIKHAIELSPSKKFISFLQGIIGTIQSGSDLNNYLENVSDKFLEDDLIERKKHIELLGVVAEAFVISVIAFPIFLVIILSIMGFFGGSMDFSIFVLFVFSFLFLPLIYLAFYVLIRSTTSENISRYVALKKTEQLSFFEKYKTMLLVFGFSVLFSLIFVAVMYALVHQGIFQESLYLNLDIVFLVFLFLITPVSFYMHLKHKEKKDMQERLPDFLIEVSDSLSSGMNALEAIKVAEKGRYGKLNDEIKKMKAQLSWNLSVREVFVNFSERVKSGIIQRIVVTINEGLIMGGNTAKLFKAAAKEVNQINSIEHQRKANMSIYMSVIILCFFVFLAIILILEQTIFTSFFELQAKQISQVGSVINISQVDPVLLKYALFSFVYVQAIGAGLLAGYMMDGKVASGVRYACVLAVISFFVFKLLF